MNTTATISLSDYVIAIGNQFFNLDDKDWDHVQDDLNYETIEMDGLNGYLLKVEQYVDDYSSMFTKHLILVYNYLKSLVVKDIQEKTEGVNSANNNTYTLNSKQVIHNKVRSRLLEVINEDVGIWELQKRRNVTKNTLKKNIKKNTFKDKLRE